MTKSFYSFETARKYAKKMVAEGKKIEWKLVKGQFKIIVKG
jgi:hypothetical protein